MFWENNILFKCKRNNILDYLNNFDEKVNLISQKLYDNKLDIVKEFLDITALEVGTYNYSHIIKLNPLLGGNNSLFGKHFVLYLKEFVDISTIGTTNYNSFIEDITKEEVYYLNGSIKDYYDPYLNKIISFDENKDKKHIIVPFLFTQRGIKPLTSVKMSERYVDMFNKFKESDIICVCGFAFNCDDGHINGLFRELIEDYNKTICILHYVDGSQLNIRTAINEYKEKLRLDSTSDLRIIAVDRNRNEIISGEKWVEVLVRDVNV